LLFLVPAMSLAGLPPLSGFFAKLSLVRAGLEVGQYTIVAVSLGVGLLTLFSMIKLWNEAFWKPVPEVVGNNSETAANLRAWLIPIAFLASITIIIGGIAGQTFALALLAGEQLMNPALYIQAVLGGAP
jgi:multicomponent Na+:H+ antiporter subunit D